MSVNLLLSLPSGEKRVCHVDDDALVSIVVTSWDVSRLILSSDELWDENSNSTDRHSFGVEQVVSSAFMIDCHILTLSLSLRLYTMHELIHQSVWHGRKSMSNIWIVWNFLELFFWFITWEIFIKSISLGLSIRLKCIFFLFLQKARKLYLFWFNGFHCG